jgi:hypothetical protein
VQSVRDSLLVKSFWQLKIIFCEIMTNNFSKLKVFILLNKTSSHLDWPCFSLDTNLVSGEERFVYGKLIAGILVYPAQNPHKMTNTLHNYPMVLYLRRIYNSG